MKYNNEWVLQYHIRYAWTQQMPMAIIGLLGAQVTEPSRKEIVVLWLSEWQVTVKFINIYADNKDALTFDKSEITPYQIRAHATEYRRSVAWLCSTIAQIQRQKKEGFGFDDIVEVKRSTKRVPSGYYRIGTIRSGKHSRYAKLRSLDRRAYIGPRALSACYKVPPETLITFYQKEYRSLLWTLAELNAIRKTQDLATRRENYVAVLALADTMEEIGDPQSCHIRAAANYYLCDDHNDPYADPPGKRKLFNHVYANYTRAAKLCPRCGYRVMVDYQRGGTCRRCHDEIPASVVLR